MSPNSTIFPDDFEQAVNETVSEVMSKEKDKRSDKDAKIQQLVKLVCEGNYQAFEEVYLYSIESLTKFLSCLFHSRHDAEETAQETFAYIWENRGKIDPKKNFKGYLYVIAKRMAFRQMARNKLDQKYYEYKSHVTDYYDISPDELIMNEELALIISIYIDNMPDQRRRVFQMSRIEEKSIDEIAKELNISYNTVKNHLQKGLNGLKELITLFITLFFLP